MRRKEFGRKSRDKMINGNGWKMVDAMEEMGLEIFNGEMEGDEKGEFTYRGHMGNTVIDYVIGDEEVKGVVRRISVEERVDSDHLPVVITIKGKEIGRIKAERKGGEFRGVDWGWGGRKGIWKENGGNRN